MFLIQYTSSGLPTQSALNQLIFIVESVQPFILSTALKILTRVVVGCGGVEIWNFSLNP